MTGSATKVVPTKRVACMICVLIVSACMAVFALSSCAPEEEEPTEEVFVSPYSWENLKQSAGRFFYYKDGNLASRVGIDVSSYQGSIDWAAVADDGIEFAFIRIGNRGYTEGRLYLDEQYQANIEGAKNAGIPVGVYFFSQAINDEEAREEAAFVIENLAGAELEYPVVFDHEPVSDPQGRANKLSSDQLSANARIFCEAVEGAGYSAMVYGNKKDVGRLHRDIHGDYGVWFAEYDVAVPSGQFDFTIWQYSNTGTVSGIPTGVDMNIHFLEA